MVYITEATMAYINGAAKVYNTRVTMVCSSYNLHYNGTTLGYMIGATMVYIIGATMDYIFGASMFNLHVATMVYFL